MVTRHGPKVLHRGVTQLQAYEAIIACIDHLVEMRAVPLREIQRVEEQRIAEENRRRQLEKKLDELKNAFASGAVPEDMEKIFGLRFREVLA